jgi:hypothetical protein
MHAFPTPTRAQLLAAERADARAREHMQRARTSGNDVTTDTDRLDDMTTAEHVFWAHYRRTEARLLRQGNVEHFIGLFTLGGDRLRARFIDATRMWALYDAHDVRTRLVVGGHRPLLASFGFREDVELARAELQVVLAPDATWVMRISRRDGGYPDDAVPYARR